MPYKDLDKQRSYWREYQKKYRKEHPVWAKVHDKEGNSKRIYNPMYERKRHLKRRYGISEEVYDALVKQQDGVCAICGGNNGGKKLVIDHDHRTGAIRRLLCYHCNIGLGYLEDGNFMIKATEYLESYYGR